MRGLEDRWKDKVTFIRKGIQEPDTEELMKQLDFGVVPASIVLDPHGNEVTRFNGLRTADEINQMLTKATKP